MIAWRPWAHLPNSKHIDWIVESVEQYPELWRATRTTARIATHAAAWGVAYSAAHAAARHVIYHAAWNDDWAEAWDSILALLAYDDCEQYLSMTSEELKAWALLTEHPAAILLLPMVIVREQIEQAAT